MAVGTKLFFDMMHEMPPKVMLFGGSCSHVTAPIAESAVWWNMWQLSFADTNPELSDRSKYPRFFRNVPSDSDYNPARIQLLRHYNWTRVGTLFQDASKGSSRFAYAHNKLVDLLQQAGVDRELEGFASDPKPALTNLKQKDIRIIVGNFDEEMAIKVFCSAFNESMFGPRYTWIIPGDYRPWWWRFNGTHRHGGCKQEELRAALEGHFSTDVLSLSTSTGPVVSDISPQEYYSMYQARRENAYSKYHGYAYDGIWVIAKSIDDVISHRGNSFDITDFRTDRFQQALNETNFVGVTGRVRFRDGDRVGGILLQQFQDQGLVTVGEYDAETDSLNLSKGQAIRWRGKGPPRDRTLVAHQLQRVDSTFYIILCTLAGGGIVVAIFFLTINIKFRRHRYIKMSSPNMNNVIIIGCLLAYISVFLLGTDGGEDSPKYYPFICTARLWIIASSFTFAFGAMFSKTWRVHAIFTNIKLNKKVIKDYKLVMIVAVLFGVDVIILGTWQYTDPLERNTRELPPEADPNGSDVEIIPVIEFCISKHMTIWLAVIYAYKGLLLIVGCFLAWETRHVSIPALNDSKYIGMSVYNVVILCVSGAAISFIVQDQQNSAFLIIGLFIIFCTTITLCLVFVPKVVELKRTPKENDHRVRATLKKSTTKTDSNAGSELHQKLRVLAEENIKYHQILERRTRELEQLLQQVVPDGYLGCADMEVTKDPLRRNSKIHPVIPHGSLEEVASLYSAPSATNIWNNDAANGPVVQNSNKEMIELSKLGNSKKRVSSIHVQHPIDSDDDDEEGEPGPEVALMKVELPPPGYDEAVSSKNGNSRPSSVFSGSRTPSYQGLKFLSEVLFLKETAILSDSEHSDTLSEKSLPGTSLQKERLLTFTKHELPILPHSSESTDTEHLITARITHKVPSNNTYGTQNAAKCSNDKNRKGSAEWRRAHKRHTARKRALLRCDIVSYI